MSSTPNSDRRSSRREMLRAHYGGATNAGTDEPSGSSSSRASLAGGSSQPRIDRDPASTRSNRSARAAAGSSRVAQDSRTQFAEDSSRRDRGSRVAKSNVESLGGGGGGAGMSGVEGGSIDLDSPDFSPEAYHRHILSTASLSGLVKASNVLTVDLKSLHASRHTLVYNHHSQLSSASRTLHALNERVPEIQAVVAGLQEKFDEMSKIVEGLERVPPRV